MTGNTKKLVRDCAILLTILVIGIFIGHQSKHIDMTATDKQIADRDTIINLLTKERQTANIYIKQLEEANDDLKEKDSMLTSQYQSSQNLYKLINDKFKKVDDIITVVTGNSDSLLAAYKRYE